MAPGAPLHVSLVAVPGTLSMPVAGLYEVLNAFPVLASFYDDIPEVSPFQVEIVGAEQTTMAAASGLPITIQRAFRDVVSTDIVIVPTMAVDQNWRPGRHPELVEWLQAMHGTGTVLCSACTGLVILAETGLLDGQRATTHWAIEPVVRACFPEVELCLNEVLLTAGQQEELVMSGGGASWQDLVLYLIGRFVSPGASRAMAKFEMLEQHAEGQAPYLPFLPPVQHGDSLIRAAQHWLETHFTDAGPVAGMAAIANLSPRSLERRFRRATGYSPIDYVQRVRIEEAKRRLEQTDAAIDQIGWDVGYQDPAAFRRLFKRIARVTPGAYRRKFAVPDLGRNTTGYLSRPLYPKRSTGGRKSEQPLE
ncbi:GlxA family transcriptional regulator [Marinobacter sp. LN3S78]|uniref:GlxA family transcriptional regulator n=1 Tax=Marinobacter sp. LN3S78 TaxID=3382300 RepID=UPI00387B89C6